MLKRAEANMLKLHNRYRAERNRAKLCVNPRLQRAARSHSRDMLRRNYLSHHTKGSGAGPGRRISRTGYRWRAYGENIARGQGKWGNPSPIFRAWHNSRGHRINMVEPQYREVGISVAHGPYRGNPGYSVWTVDFGRR